MKKKEKVKEIEIDSIDKLNSYQNKEIFPTVKENIDYIKKILDESMDLITNEFSLHNAKQDIKIGIAHISGLSNLTLVNETILETIKQNFSNNAEEIPPTNVKDYFKKKVLLFSEMIEQKTFGIPVVSMLSGDTIIFIEGIQDCFVLGSKGFKERSIEQPTTHITVKGPKESFTENIATNLTMLRRRVKNPNLWLKKYIIGEESNTTVTIAYLYDLTPKELVMEVDKRIKAIKINNLVDSSYLAQLLKDRGISVFPQVYDTERPDVVASNLFEGRIAIFMDGSPFVIIAPVALTKFLHSAEDHYHKAFIGSFLRFSRIIAFLLSFYLPAIYLSVIMHHSELLPLDLFYSIIGQRFATPLPAVLEVLLTLTAFDILREAGTRMPTSIGTTLSFVGAIIIGQSAVEAGIISSIIVIVTTTSMVAGLTLPNYSLHYTVLILRYYFVIAAALFGLFGIMIASVFLLIHVMSLRSFGLLYSAPLVPFSKEGMKDAIIRVPISDLQKNQKTTYENSPY